MTERTTSQRLTTPRKLHSGAPLWATSSGLSVRTNLLRRDVHTDVAIIGAGISGALMAYALLARGFSVIMLDRRAPGDGSTMASTALLQYELDVPLFELADNIGWNAARRIWHRSYQGIQALTDLIKRERIRCAFTASSGLYLAGNAYGSRALAKEHRARTRAGLPGKLLSAKQLDTQYGLSRTAAIESGELASANPAQLTAGLLRRCVSAGARIYSPAEVQELHAGRSDVVLRLANGLTVTSRHVVFCTGYELPKVVRTDPGDRVNSTWALATDPVPNLPQWLRHTLVWEASNPYLYLRATPDGRIVAGGEDEPSPSQHEDRRLLRLKTAAVAAKIRELLPQTKFRVRHRWAGAFGESPDGCPLIGPIDGFPHCYSVTGFGGNGITFSMVASELVSAAIAGAPDPDTHLFRSARDAKSL